MSYSLDSFQPDGTGNLTESEEKLLSFALGERKCDDDFSDKVVNFLGLALVATFIFILISFPYVDIWFSRYVPNPYARLLAKAFLFFVLIYILDLAVSDWKGGKNICK